MRKGLQGNGFREWLKNFGSRFERFGSKNSTYVKKFDYEIWNRRASESWITGSLMVGYSIKSYHPILKILEFFKNTLLCRKIMSLYNSFSNPETIKQTTSKTSPLSDKKGEEK